jgi:hypothetical protein
METKSSEQNEEPQFWFNLKTLKVEKGLKSPAPHRVGPFLNSKDAAAALETIRARSKAWQDSESED